MSAFGRYCCKSILTVRARNMDSISHANVQHRSKSAYVPFVSFKFEFHSRAAAGFCNTIGTFRISRDVRLELAKWANRTLMRLLSPIAI
jgi:hypothetical protein